jgi:hypothetical protein
VLRVALPAPISVFGFKPPEGGRFDGQRLTGTPCPIQGFGQGAALEHTPLHLSG